MPDLHDTDMTSSTLAHLSHCQVDAHTIKVGLAIGHAISIGAARESKLIEALDTVIEPLTSRMAILKDLCKTTDGRAIVTLCCALSVGYHGEVPGEILYAVAKQCGEQATVSVAQCNILIQVCAVVFEDEILRENIEGNLSIGMTKPPTLPLKTMTGGPLETLAKILLRLGQVVAGELRCVHVTGIDQCGWIALWAEDVLGLRVEVYDQNGRMRRHKFDLDFEEAQVTIRFVKTQGLSTSLLTVVTE